MPVPVSCHVSMRWTISSSCTFLSAFLSSVAIDAFSAGAASSSLPAIAPSLFLS
jgi:hypothetical protein